MPRTRGFINKRIFFQQRTSQAQVARGLDGSGAWGHSCRFCGTAIPIRAEELSVSPSWIGSFPVAICDSEKYLFGMFEELYIMCFLSWMSYRLKSFSYSITFFHFLSLWLLPSLQIISVNYLDCPVEASVLLNLLYVTEALAASGIPNTCIIL